MKRFKTAVRKGDWLVVEDGGIYKVRQSPFWLKGLGWWIPTRIVVPPKGTSLKPRWHYELCQPKPTRVQSGRFKRVTQRKELRKVFSK